MLKKWLTAQEAKKILGYRDQSSVSRTVKKFNVRRKPDPKGRANTDYLYHKDDLMDALGEINYKYDSSSSPGFRKFNTYQQLEGDWLQIADAHCPLVDWGLFQQLLKTRDQMEIGQLILAGDTLDCSAQSHFLDLFSIPWHIEKEVAREFLKACLKEFDRVVLLTANHEFRYLRLLNSKYPESMIEQDEGKRLDVWETVLSDLHPKWKDKLTVSLYPFCDVNNEWRVCHPSTFRKIPLSFAREMSALWGMSVIVTHAHMSAWSYAPNSKHQLIDCGVFADPLGFSYKNLKVTAHYDWTESYVAIKDNVGYIFRKGDNLPAVV